MGTRPPWSTGRAARRPGRAPRRRRATRPAGCPGWSGPRCPGLLAAVAFPPYGIWPLALVGARPRSSCCAAARAGAAVRCSASCTASPSSCRCCRWSGVYVGLPAVVPAGGCCEASFLALYGALAALFWRLPARAAVPGRAVGRRRGGPVAVPFGGFPWGRLAFTSPDSTLAPLAALGGAPLVGFVTALVGDVAGGGRAARRHRCGVELAAAHAAAQHAGLVAAALALVFAGLLVPTPGGSDADRGRRGRAGQRPPGRAGLQQRARAGAEEPRRGHRVARPSRCGPARSPSPTSCCGRRTPPTSTRSATPPRRR